ncbi:DNA translocase FtsK, partial [Acidithiobacillus caldus]
MPSVSSDAARSKSRKGAPAPRRRLALFSHLRKTELWLLMLTLLGAFTAMAVYSFHPLDPNWFNSGRGEGVRNLGGTAGANLADALIQLVGVSAWIFPVLLLYWAWGLARQTFWRQPFPWWRPVAMLPLLATISTMAAQFWPAASWPFPSQSAGGLLGEAILALLLPRIGVGGLLLVEL